MASQGGTSAASPSRHRLQALKSQAFRVFHTSQIEPADEGRDRLAVTASQRDHGVDGNPLVVHGMSPEKTPATRACKTPINSALTVSLLSPIERAARIRKTAHWRGCRQAGIRVNCS